MNMKSLAQHWFKAGILLVLIAAVTLVAYYFMDFLPSKEAGERAIQELQAADEKSQQAELLQTCLSGAADDYSNNWASNCMTSGTSNKGPDCTLPLTLAGSINQSLKDAKDECFKEYPQS